MNNILTNFMVRDAVDFQAFRLELNCNGAYHRCQAYIVHPIAVVPMATRQDR